MTNTVLFLWRILTNTNSRWFFNSVFFQDIFQHNVTAHFLRSLNCIPSKNNTRYLTNVCHLPKHLGYILTFLIPSSMLQGKHPDHMPVSGESKEQKQLHSQHIQSIKDQGCKCIQHHTLEDHDLANVTVKVISSTCFHFVNDVSSAMTA